MSSNILRWLYVVCIIGLVTALAPTDNADAADGTAVCKPGKGNQPLFLDPDSGKMASPEECRVGRKFFDFCSRWIGSKNGFAMKSAGNKTNGSTIIKEYSQCGDAYELRITKAKGSNVYVGTLKYIEKVFRAPDGQAGKTGSAPFALAQEVPVTEFFMFKNGKWCY